MISIWMSKFRNKKLLKVLLISTLIALFCIKLISTPINTSEVYLIDIGTIYVIKKENKRIIKDQAITIKFTFVNRSVIISYVALYLHLLLSTEICFLFFNKDAYASPQRPYCWTNEPVAQLRKSNVSHFNIINVTQF